MRGRHGAAGSRRERSDERGGDRRRLAGGPGGPLRAAGRQGMERPRRHGAAASPLAEAAWRKCPRTCPPDQCDARLLAVWQEELLAGCLEAEPWRFLYDRPSQRREVLGHLRTAVERRDEAAIVEWTRQPCLAGYPLPAAWAEPIKRPAPRPPHRGDVGRLGEAGSRRRFTNRSTCGWFAAATSVSAPHQALLAEWIRAEVLPPEKLGLRAADKDGLAAVATIRRATGACNGPGRPPRLADRCVLAVCPAEPDAGRRSANGGRPSSAMSIDRTEWDSGGGSRLIRSDEAGRGLTWWCGRSSMRVSDLCQPAAGARSDSAPLALEMEGVAGLFRPPTGERDWGLGTGISRLPTPAGCVRWELERRLHFPPDLRCPAGVGSDWRLVFFADE